MKKLLTFTALSAIFAIAEAEAAGFHLREQSAAAQGNAYAGATAGAENLSYTYFNPAGITRQEGTNVHIGGTYIAPRARAKKVYNHTADKRGENVDNIVHAAVAPNMAVSKQLSERAFAGLALNVPYGMITKYDEAWVGGQHGVTSKLTAITLTPTFAYKATDKLSIGAGLQVQYLKARLTSGKVPGQVNASVEGKAVDWGWQAGGLYEFNDSTRVGLSYRSKIAHKLKGKQKVRMASDGSMIPSQPDIDIYAHLTTPAMLSMGVYHDINEKWAVMAEYQRVFWSSFRDLHIRDYNGGVNTTYEKWRNTNFYALGASYQIDNQWKWRLGMAYDQAAVGLHHRTPRIPDSDRLWYSTGLNYQYNEKLSFDVSYTYIYAHKAHMDTAVTGNAGDRITAEYSNSIQLFGVSLNYKF
ncbi:MAG: outer membrane protein transport protein [Alphaproteobacteria bacterium]|nr:outer membrane protein transport protein [Alphaproteobacteria bacterium]